MGSLVSIKGLSKSYGSNKVIDDLSLSIKPGRIIGLLGENGVGKTTLLRILADLLKTDKGEIKINGIEVSTDSHTEVSYMMEPSSLYPWMKIKDAINFYHDMYDDFDRKKAFEICELINLYKEQKISKLSKGNQERVMIILALSRKVPLYLFDEPIASLDPKMKKNVINLILSNIEEDSTVIISSHLLKDLEGIFDEILIMSNKKIIAATADEIREKYKTSIEDYYLEVMGNA